MRPLRASPYVWCFVVGMLGGCANPFRDLADKTSEKYRIDQAEGLLNSYKFDDAITAIDPVVAAHPTDERIVNIAVSAYAGRAGLRILDMLEAIGTDLSTKGIFRIFADHFVESDADKQSDIENAKDLIEAYGARGVNRSASMNFLAMFVYYSRIGVVLNRYAYNGTTQLLSTFKACHTTSDFNAATTGLPDSAVDIVMTSIPRILDAASGIASSTDSRITSITSIPGVPTDLGFDPIPCSADSNNTTCKTVRSLINIGPSEISGTIGLATGEGACATVSTP
ncbi:MAG: hypothetical protein JST16_04855 [Bdellovibrionales bacterium]|nr:hypothetical protein [Bdellovibrionales bacterium]